MSRSKLKGIWPLPGGTRNFVTTLLGILQKVGRESPTLDDLVAWLKEKYSLSGSNTPYGYIRVIREPLGFFEKSNGRIRLTSAGQEFVETRNNKIVLDGLRGRVLGFEEIFQILANGRKLELEEIHKELTEKCQIEWKTTTQTFYRLLWLVNLGYVDREKRKYHLVQTDTSRVTTPQAPVTPQTPLDGYLKNARGIMEKHPAMSEADTISTLIEPLLETLGWSVRDPDEVGRGYPISKGERTDYVDIALKLNNKPVVFIEAKSIDISLQDYMAEQPMRYANAEGVSWFALTNGLEWRLYNAFWKIKGIEQKMLFKLSIDEFIKKTDLLTTLSKNSVASGNLDEQGELEHARRMALEWLRENEDDIVKRIKDMDKSLNENCVRQVLKRMLSP